MPRAVISVENLSKVYLVGHRGVRGQGHGYVALRDSIGRELRNAARKGADILRGRQVVQGDEVEEFWALKNVSFEVKEGEVLGIIGRNGAGKSTLLKILSRITEPTAGRVTLRGRVSSLLEVGTGFHPELSGRENIYLNGAILGMSRGEIRRKFDEIVAFAEIEKFLDTPVKRYSSGMYVRLAFAVAAHLEPEILIVDEVLAVGDSEFQKKCLGKMSDVAGGGRTILFVSHSMNAITTLCPRSLLLSRGSVLVDGLTSAAITAYVRQYAPAQDGGLWTWPKGNQPGNADFRLASVEIRGERSAGTVFSPDEPLHVAITYEQLSTLTLARIVVELESESGDVAFAATDQSVRGNRAYPPGLYTSVCTIPGGLLNRMAYKIRLWASVPGVVRLMDPVVVGQFQIEGVGNEGSLFTDPTWPGVVCPRVDWTVEPHRSSLAVTVQEAARPV